MREFLVQHALDNVWCNPEQDNQLLIHAFKLTPQYGVVNEHRIMLRTVRMPETGKRYHVFQVGQVYPSLLGLLKVQPSWGNEVWTKF